MPTKTLYIARHAKSSWKDMSLSDFERPLNARGKRDAPFMANLLKGKGIHPELILSSPAKRAKKTPKTPTLHQSRHKATASSHAPHGHSLLPWRR